MYFDNEEGLTKTNEQRKQNIEMENARYGYTENGSPFYETSEYTRLMTAFIHNKARYIHNFNLPPRTTDFIRKHANSIIIDQTGSLDRRVLYFPDDERLIYDFNAQYGDITEEKYEDFIKFIKRKARKREVTSLPITWTTDRARSGSSYTYANHPQDIELVKMLPIVSVGIKMINQNDDLGISVLVHEMTHALTERNKGIIQNKSHDEVLTIYLEFVAAYEFDPSGKLLEITMRHRLQELKGDMIYFDYQRFNGEIPTGDNYIDSSLYAFALFEQYRNASDNSRRALRKEINEVLAGNRTLEETLDILSVTEEEGSHIIRGHIKTILK